ncbi:MAG: hypothetical protein A4E69_00974 [Syntrophus sp. PtaB.Bin138]|nr:MAG: hypothetical protein A4E69_00974 [Syntrophus sp. PtaB.Bin138]
MHPGEPVQFALRLLLRLLRQVLFRDFLAVLLDLDLGLVRFAQLLLDRLELLAEIIFPLALVHVALDLGLDLAAQLQDLDLMIDQTGHLLEALLDVQGFQNPLLLLHGGVDDGGDHVGQDPGRSDGFGHGTEFLRQQGRQFDDPVEQVHQIRHQRLRLQVLDLFIFKVDHPGLDVRLARHEFRDAETADPLDEELRPLIAGLGHFQDDATGPDLMEILRFVPGFRGGFFRHDQTDEPVSGHGLIDQGHGLLAENLHGKHHFRKKQNVEQGEKGQHFGNFDDFEIFRRSLFRHREPP